jgi:TPR repeat protein
MTSLRALCAGLVFAVLPVTLPLSARASERCPEAAALEDTLARADGEGERASLLRRAVAAKDGCVALTAMLQLVRTRQALLAKAYPEVDPSELKPDGSVPYGAVLARKGKTDQVVPALLLEARYLATAAEVALWRIYQDGYGEAVPANDPRILALFRELAADDVPRMQLNLGVVYRKGLGLPEDGGLAEQWLTRASSSLDEAKVELGLLVLDQRRFEEARRLLEEVVRGAPDDGAAVGALALVYLSAPAPLGDCEKGKALLLRAGDELHDGDALLRLAVAHSGRDARFACFPASDGKVAYYVQAAAGRGNVQARRLLAGRKEPQVTEEMIGGWRRSCSEDASPRACYNLAVTYAQSMGDEPKAIPLYEKSCAADFRSACYNLGGVLIKERATREQGIRAFEKACKLPGTDDPDLVKRACLLAERTRKYQDLDYDHLAPKLFE